MWDEEGMLLCLQAFFFHPLPFECVSSAPYIIEGLKNIIMCFFASLDLMEGE